MHNVNTKPFSLRRVLCYTFKYMNRGFTIIIVIILGLLISLFTIGYFRDDVASKSNNTLLPNYQKQTSYSCGLTLYSPSANDIVGTNIHIEGIANGCGWGDARSSFIGIVRIVNDRSVIISEKNIDATSGDIDIPLHFDMTVAIPKNSLTRKGFLIFSNQRDSSESRELRIPVMFW